MTKPKTATKPPKAAPKPRARERSPKPATIDKSYSSRVAASLLRIRTDRGISVKDLAPRFMAEAAKDGEVLTLDEATRKIWHWEAGRHRIALDLLPAIARALGLGSPAELLPAR